ncbi:hypothetical protein ACYJ1Y_11405 [Natrialbaceae archaeon A-gly3]
MPVRDTSIDRSKRTLERARERAQRGDDGYVVVLHVDRAHRNETTNREEFDAAVSRVLSDFDYEVVTRQGIVVERVILEEAKQLEADVIIVGRTRKLWWRHVANRIVAIDPDVGQFLDDRTRVPVDVV